MSRFLKEIQINPLGILRMIAVFLRLKKINKIGLIVDRTNWKRGEKYLNFLFIALKTKNWTIPVWVLPMCEQKQGNHKTTCISFVFWSLGSFRLPPTLSELRRIRRFKSYRFPEVLT